MTTSNIIVNGYGDTHKSECTTNQKRQRRENSYSYVVNQHVNSLNVAKEEILRYYSVVHTIMAEALEKWPIELFSRLLPRIYQIVEEINRRLCADLWKMYPGDWDRISRMAIVAYNQVRMANLSVIGSHSVNGVSKLHSDILTKSIFKDFYAMYPEKFCNVTNGIAHRRWLCYSNPRLASLLDECIGPQYRKEPERLLELAKYADDAPVLEAIRDIKHGNKVAFSNYLMRRTGRSVDTHSVFDTQIKRLHEYKRQLLNALNIIGLYLDLRENPDLEMQPQTFIFGAKAAPGYHMAKQIIRLLCYISRDIEGNPRIREKLQVIFLEDYNVSLAEVLIPAAEISEQISLAGKEASGTGCMKLMMNGALTIGTLDGANVEMLAAAGEENMFIFGLSSREVDELWTRGYHAASYYGNNERLKKIVNHLHVGFAGESFSQIAMYLLSGQGIADPYMCLGDFESYRQTHEEMIAAYADKARWNRMSLMNIASSGHFAADRSIEEYATRIWGLKKLSLEESNVAKIL